MKNLKRKLWYGNKYALICFAILSLFIGTAIGDVTIDNGGAGTSFTGTWSTSGGADPYGSESLFARPAATYTWQFESQPAGDYEVFLWWTETDTRGDAVEVTINTSSGPTSVFINQQANGGQWNSVGTFNFDGSGSVTVAASSDLLGDGRTVSTCADAVWFRQVSGNVAPAATIDSITPNPAGSGELVVFTGHGDDTDGSVTAYSWDSDLDGHLSDADNFSTSALSEGQHQISFMVQDNEGVWSAEATMSLTVGTPPIELVIDNGDSGTSFTGTWSPSSGVNPYGENSLYARPDATYTWQFDSQPAGMYEVYIWYTTTTTRNDAVPVDINGIETVSINQQINGGQWNLLGSYYFDGSGYVTVTAVTSASTCADAVRFNYVSSNNAPTAEILSIDPSPAGSGAVINFSGQGQDTDGTITDYAWESSIDGAIGNTGSFSASLSDGIHEISFRVMDNEGTWSAAVSQTLTVGDILYTGVIDNGDPETSYTGEWFVSARPNWYGENSLYSRDGATYTYSFTLPASADYVVNMWWTDYTNRSDNVPIDITYEGGTQTVYVNQQANGGQWNSLGQYYFAAGNTYTVTITAQPGPSSTCADAVQFMQVDNDVPPMAEFSASSTAGVLPLTVQFTDLSTGNIDSWLWDFGDGDTSTEASPSHTYVSDGNYTVSLTVTNSYGSDTETKNAYITVIGSNVENIYIANGWGSADSYIWEETERNIRDLGATEIETDVWQYTNTDKGVTYYIRHVNTVAGFEAAIREQGSHVIFSGHSNYGLGLGFLQSYQQESVQYFDDPLISNVSTDFTDPSIPGLRFGQAYPNWNPEYSWGESAIMPYDFDDPSGKLPPYNFFATYTLPGDSTHYRIEAADGSYIERFPDSGRPAWYSPTGDEPDPVLNPEYFITNSGDDWERCEFVGTWEYASPGDWHTAVFYMGQNYQYHGPGTGSNSATFTLPVKIPGVYAVMATWYPDPANASNATYTIQHTDVGAGEFDTVVVDQRASAGVNMLGAYYFDVGSYTLELTDNADGNVVADVIMLTFVNDPQTVTRAEFSSDRNSGSGPMTVQFIDQSTIYINGNYDPGVEYEWDFGDGNTSTVRDPMHTYTTSGTYTVTLTVTDELGNTDTEVKDSFIVVDGTLPFNAQFTITNDLVGTRGSASINFLDQSTGEITGWLWDFGDGETSTEQNPTHTYNGSGTFTVTLTVTGPGGTDSETETDFVYSTVGLVAVDNTFDTKPHYYRNYSGTLLGSTIMDARPVAFPNEAYGYSRLFFNGCVSEAYYLPKFTHGIVFYTLGSRDAEHDPTFEYLTNYLTGATDDDLLQIINSVNYIHGYYNFNLLPPSMR